MSDRGKKMKTFSTHTVNGIRNRDRRYPDDLQANQGIPQHDDRLPWPRALVPDSHHHHSGNIRADIRDQRG